MKITSDVRCHHCGTPCEDHLIAYDKRSFCCSGCKTIYQLFRESGNEAFYEGKSLNTALDKYAFLENYEIARRFINFSSEGVNHVSLSLPAVHCSSCVYVLENLPKVHEGVIRLSLNFSEKTASIYYDPQLISLQQLASLLDSIGYPPRFDAVEGQENKKKSRSLALKIGIAGFCFGNIMLLSFPSYLGMEMAELDNFGPFFGILMLVLSLPVFFYAGKDYLVSAFKSVISGYIHIDVPIALGMATLFMRSAYEILTFTGEGYLDSLSGLVFFLLLGRWFQQKAYGHLSFDRDYSSYFPLAVLREVGTGELVSTPVQHIAVDHILIIRHNEILPTDATLLSENAMMDYSFVTGEDRLNNRLQGDFLYAGGRQMGQSIRVRVNKPCSQSYLTQLWNNPAFSNITDTNRHLMINKVSRYFTWIILFIALAAGVYWANTNNTKIWEVVSAVLIVACPCALALATPFTNGNTLRIFGRNHFYLRNADTAEHLGNIDIVVLDKTGTITSTKNSKIQFFGFPLTSEEEKLIQNVVRHSTHPVSRKVAEHLSTGPVPVQCLEDCNFTEIPGKGIQADIGNNHIRIGSSIWIRNQSDEEGRVYVELNGNIRGYFLLQNSLRPGLLQSLLKLSADYPLIILSGDSSHEQEWLSGLLPEKTEMHFRMSPYDKLNFVQDLRKSGKKVLMIGDGLNDAGALKESDVGVAVTEDISQFSPASDGILEGNQLINLPQYLAFSRNSHRIIIASFVLSFLYNVAGITLAVTGFLTPVIAAILMPLSSVTIVGFTILTGNYLANRKEL